MAGKPVILRRAGAPKKEPRVEAPQGVPVAKKASDVVLVADEGKISTSTLPIYTLRPLHRFR